MADGRGCGSTIDDGVRQVIDSGDTDALRTALAHEATERRRAECLANIQTEITQYTLDLLARASWMASFLASKSAASAALTSKNFIPVTSLAASIAAEKPREDFRKLRRDIPACFA